MKELDTVAEKESNKKISSLMTRMEKARVMVIFWLKILSATIISDGFVSLLLGSRPPYFRIFFKIRLPVDYGRLVSRTKIRK